MKTFEMRTAIHFGENALGRLKEIPYKRILIITDPFIAKSSMIDLITEPLQSAGKEYDLFSDVVPDAPVDKIAEGAALMTETTFERQFIDGTANTVPNSTLEKLMHNNMEYVPLPVFTEEELSFAAKISDTY